jgi:hypothetical protein
MEVEVKMNRQEHKQAALAQGFSPEVVEKALAKTRREVISKLCDLGAKPGNGSVKTARWHTENTHFDAPKLVIEDGAAS